MNYWAVPAMICLFFGVDSGSRSTQYYYIVYIKAQAGEAGATGIEDTAMNTPQPASSQQVLGSAMAAIERDVEVAVDDLARMIEVDTSFPPGLGYDAFADLMAE